MGSSTMPVIDPNVKYVGVSKLREMNASKLKETDDTFVLQDNDQPLAVLVKYRKFMEMQQQLMSVLNTIDLLMEEKEMAGLRAGLDDLRAGRMTSLENIEAELAGKG
jgi:predicted transcriptional regulator